jgi:tetratricopeptide (TPR) repeat protein
MPKRRPEDAPLTLVTDHWIRSHPTEPPATLPTYRGEVIAYYPEKIDDPIYLALAQVKDGTNPKATARGLQPRHPEAALVLADAHRKAGRAREAASLYRSAGNLLAAWRGLALIEFPSLQPVRRGLDQAPNDPFLLIVLGEIQRTQKQLADAQRSFELAIQADPDLPDAYINLGVTWAQQGQPFRAAEWFRQALAVGPANPTAIANLRLALSQDSSGPRRARD